MSSFHSWLIAEANQDPASQATSRDRFYQGACAGLTALIVDDDQLNQFALTALLQRGKMTVHAAAGGADALETLEHEANIDIVLMDIMMPVMDGYEAMAAIRERPDCRDLPIIAVTAADTDGEYERCIAAGASAYIAKPIRAAELLAAISHWLRPAPRAGALTAS
jgi:two-component system chemotaxis sensor kinase CheA